MARPFVAILMGSDLDLSKVQLAVDVLKKLDVPVNVKVHSVRSSHA